MTYKNEYWGGKREGAGRPKGEKTKAVRLNKLEEDLIKLIREQDSLNSVWYWVSVHCANDGSDLTDALAHERPHT